MGGPDRTPVHIEPAHLVRLGKEAGSRQPEHQRVFTKIVDSLTHRYPLVREWIMQNPDPGLREIPSNLHMGDVRTVGAKTSDAMQATIDLGKRLGHQKLSAHDELGAIHETTAKAEIQISHYIVLATILRFAGDEKDEPRLRQILARTLEHSEAIYNEGLGKDPHYSPITFASELSEYMIRSTVYAKPSDLQNLNTQRVNHLNSYQEKHEQRTKKLADIYEAVQLGTYVDAAKALLYYPSVSQSIS